MSNSFPVSNRDYSFVNVNRCKSFNLTVTTNLVSLTGTMDPLSGHSRGGEICGEVTIWNRSGGDVTIYDGGLGDSFHGFVLEDNDKYTFMGITNVDQVSAVGAGTGLIYYRTQFYSHNPSR